MRSRNDPRQDNEFSLLTPWEVQTDDAPITKYCSNLLQATPYSTTTKLNKNLPLINQKKRAISNCHNQKNESIPSSTIEKNKYNKVHQCQVENFQTRAFTTLTQHRGEKTEKKTDRGVLQQLSVKNFIIQGEQKSNIKQKGKKKESSYILKQKFNEFRRSMKSIQQFKENCNLKVIRYD